MIAAVTRSEHNITYHRRTGQHPFGGSKPVLPEWSRTYVLSFARINVISARIWGSTAPPDPRPVSDISLAKPSNFGVGPKTSTNVQHRQPSVMVIRIRIRIIYLVIFQTQETSAKTISGRCRRGHLEK